VCVDKGRLRVDENSQENDYAAIGIQEPEVTDLDATLLRDPANAILELGRRSVEPPATMQPKSAAGS
jgi:hypothetical protein